MDIESLQAQLEKVQEELSQKETKIIKLKGLLTKSMRSDKSREAQITALQLDLSDRDRHIESLNKELEEHRNFSNKQSERINQLEGELNDLTMRLQSGVGSEAAQKRNERMKQMLEKSNMLYAELETKYHKVCDELEQEKAKNRKISRPKHVIILKKHAVTLNEDNTYSIGEPQSVYPSGVTITDTTKESAPSDKHNPSSSAQSSDANVLKIYLKRVLLEFFIGDSQTQTRLIPVILSLLDCSNDQVIAAQRSFAEGRQLISKAAAALNI
ncbi:hypothetical protein TVAG_172230 [Trichomonas vaginalis G3]|uniref:Uncharacterized protein n=1 Tax=Trichomonas vaginalis (strain ATCC PRA-98 / G3) TaxID=412133 RepID=A2DEX4_TRIV3|nr:biological adhesion protein [Trichomonas vaginalis G3]EAY20966.1 hypothetical protein TVAG_172230 [Trichomonas vaginalis G3]KAI5519126.1 biological adhesion protein [Trichomonas vaginalis G3]|eukprot:XP_001581952.1 hypothetical protein [Trichomonas vaginalis G3]